MLASATATHLTPQSQSCLRRILVSAPRLLSPSRNLIDDSGPFHIEAIIFRLRSSSLTIGNTVTNLSPRRSFASSATRNKAVAPTSSSHGSKTSAITPCPVRAHERAMASAQELQQALAGELSVPDFVKSDPNATPVFFFDVDNTLYSAKIGIADLMGKRIRDYFKDRIGIHPDEVDSLATRYYIDYGLAIRGLVKHHSNVDPVEYDELVDGGLPLEEILHEDKPLRDMLQRLKIRKWVFTNAGINHAKRVLRILGVADQFEGITYVNYAEPDFACKPYPEAFWKAMKEAGISDPHKCYLVDDSPTNLATARRLGWTTVFVSERAGSARAVSGEPVIEHVHELEIVLPQLFSKKEDQ